MIVQLMDQVVLTDLLTGTQLDCCLQFDLIADMSSEQKSKQKSFKKVDQVLQVAYDIKDQKIEKLKQSLHAFSSPYLFFYSPLSQCSLHTSPAVVLCEL